jgi:cytochrome P450
VARPDDVREALASPALTVVPAVPSGGADRVGEGGGGGEVPGRAARELQGRMARFSDGTVHQARRERVLALLPDAVAAERAARAVTIAALAGRTGSQEAMELARRVPVEVLAGALGVPGGQLGAVATATGQLCAALAPAPGAAGVAEGERAAFALLKILAGREGDDRALAVISVLFQAHDATAALIGLALARTAARPGGTAAELVEAVLRDDPPVQCTRRTSARPVTIGGVTIPVGEAVWILLAAAERGAPTPPATFGSGPHGCPGRDLATALARGVVSGVLEAGWQPAAGDELGYQPRPNLRMPVSVPVNPR